MPAPAAVAARGNAWRYDGAVGAGQQRMPSEKSAAQVAPSHVLLSAPEEEEAATRAG